MKLHVLTAVSRPENLGLVGESLAKAAAAAQVDVDWHWRLDPLRQWVGGQFLKNVMLNEIQDMDDWVWVLDDDTLAHPGVLEELMLSLECDMLPPSAVVFSQLRTDGRVLHAAPENVRLGFIDIGQAFLRRGAIGDTRIPLSYEGDFHFLNEILTVLWAQEDVHWIDEPLSLHNAISGVDVSV